MKLEYKIKNEAITSTTTGEEADFEKEKTNDKTPTSETDEQAEMIAGDSPTTTFLSPVSRAKINRDNSEAKKNASLNNLYSLLKWFIPISVTILLFIAGIYVANILKPMGAVEEKIDQIKTDMNNLKGDISNLQTNLANTREEFIKNTK